MTDNRIWVIINEVTGETWTVLGSRQDAERAARNATEWDGEPCHVKD